MKPAALFLSIVAVLGLLKSHDAQPVLPCASQCSEVARPAVSEGQPVETPLVATLLPGGGESESPSKAAPPDHFVEPNKLVDGQLSEDGYFRLDLKYGTWRPVDFGHPRYSHNGGPVGAEHLIREHHHARSSVEKWTQEDLEIAHANVHYWEKLHGVTRSPNVSQKTDFRNTSCPSGNCPSPARSRGLFRWR